MDQQTALAILKSGRNVFLTGSAGSGKTYVLRQYIRYLKDRKIPVAVTASTGIAATHMNGVTLHAWSGIGIRDRMSVQDLRDLKTKKHFRENIEKAKVLIIDEISMLHGAQLEAARQVLSFLRSSNEPYGGIQVVVCGDFFQLPPVGKREEINKNKFAFMSAAWLDAGLTICYLTEQHRQENGPLTRILNEIREGRTGEWAARQLQATSAHEIGGDNLTRLYTHNLDVDYINIQKLNSLPGETRTFSAILKGRKKPLETLRKSVLAEETLRLKKGARVMFVKNMYEKGVMNGTLGTVTRFDSEDLPVVETMDGRTVYADHETWSVENAKGKTIASFEQIPLRLAWAITVHKSQGMTLDAAEIDLSKTFEKGQGYVALSRLRDIRGLRLVGFNQKALEVDDLVMRADKRFRELSAEAEALATASNLTHEAQLFMEKCGGVPPDEHSQEETASRKKKKTTKGSTYDETLALIREHLSVEDMMEKRGLARGTILSHLTRIKKSHPDLDMSYLAPGAELISEVKQALGQLNANTPQDATNPIGLKDLYAAMHEKVSYENLRLAMLFIESPFSG